MEQGARERLSDRGGARSGIAPGDCRVDLRDRIVLDVAVPMAAAVATIQLLPSEDGIARMRARGQQLITGLTQADPPTGWRWSSPGRRHFPICDSPTNRTIN